MAGLTSGLNRGKRKGCDQSMSSDRGEDGERCDDTLPRLNEDMELIAAFLSAWRDVVRFDVNLAFGFGVEARLEFGGDIINPSSGSSSPGGAGIKGWLRAHSSVVGTDRGVAFLRLIKDFRLRRDSGVDKLPFDNIDLSSASKEGTDSADADRVDRKLSSARLSFPGKYCSCLSPSSSNRTLSAGLLL